MLSATGKNIKTEAVISYAAIDVLVIFIKKY